MRLTGFEPAVYELKARCHTTWLQTLNDKCLYLNVFVSYYNSPFYLIKCLVFESNELLWCFKPVLLPS